MIVVIIIGIIIAVWIAVETVNGPKGKWKFSNGTIEKNRKGEIVREWDSCGNLIREDKSKEDSGVSSEWIKTVIWLAIVIFFIIFGVSSR